MAKGKHNHDWRKKGRDATLAGEASVELPLDLSNEPLTQPPPATYRGDRVGGLLRTNHFLIKHASDYKLYRYDISDILAPTENAKDSPEVIASTEGPNETSTVSRPCHKVDLRGRQKRRLFVLLRELLQERSPEAYMASNYTDQIITTQILEQSDLPGVIPVPFYDEDQLENASHITYHVQVTGPTVVEIGKHSRYLQRQISLVDAYEDDVAMLETARVNVTNALNIVLSYRANLNTIRKALPLDQSNPDAPRSQEPTLTHVGSQKFYNLRPVSDTVPNEPGLVAAQGFYRSARSLFNQELVLNVNTTTGAFYRATNLEKLILERLGYLVNTLGFQGELKWQNLERFISGLRVRTNHLISAGYTHERIFTVSGFPNTWAFWDAVKKNQSRPGYKWNNTSIPVAAELEFTPKKKPSDVEDPVPTTVERYFQKMYHLKVGSQYVVRAGKEGPLLPVNRLEVLPGQFWKQKTELQEIASHSPLENADLVTTNAPATFDFPTNRGDSQYNSRSDFGLTLDAASNGAPVLMNVPAFTLPPVSITYKDRKTKGNKNVTSNPWHLTNCMAWGPLGSLEAQPPARAKDPRPKAWTLLEICVNSDGEKSRNLQEFRINFEENLKAYGIVNIDFSKNGKPEEDWNNHKIHTDGSATAIKRRVKNILSSMKDSPSKNFCFVIVLLPRRQADLYAYVKQVADQEVGINVVCCTRGKDGTKTIPYPSNRFNVRMTMISKINLKSSATSCGHRLTIKPDLLQGATMVVGMDVTHAGVGSLVGAPSIAAMVANHDPWFAQWPASLAENPREIIADSAHPKDQTRNTERPQEKIVDLGTMLKERLACFQRYRGNDNETWAGLPNRIIFYRDGLSEAQFEMCKNEEIPQLRLAISEHYQAEGVGKKAEIMVICAVKRHHTRFYPHPELKHEVLLDAQHVDKATGKRVHPASGTTVIEGVTYGRYQDFFLISQVAQLGTARPTHYVVLENDMKEFNIMDVAEATHALSFMFGRCTTSVGVTAPAYLADKACDRARFFVRDQYTGNRTQQRWNPNHPTNPDRLNLTIHRDLRDTMFYL